jgi:hypothetical protein
MRVENDRAVSLAREFIERYVREMGEKLPAKVEDLARFAYEVGYLRGHSEGLLRAGALYDETRKKVNDETK